MFLRQKMRFKTSQHGVLLVNLGTPDSPHPRDVRRYLNEFLTDPRVIDNTSWLWRQILVRGWIVPRRHLVSSALYHNIWTAEGSPLLLHTEAAARALQSMLEKEEGNSGNYRVLYAMRYGKPSIGEVLERFQKEEPQSLTILPLFPQYASATTGSVHARVMDFIARWQAIPKIRFIHSYPTHPLMIEAFAERLEAAPLEADEHLLLSFHGVPESQLRKADCHQHCLCSASCCQAKAPPSCYRAQCMATMEALTNRLQLDAQRYSVSFQSRLGKSPWTTPYTDETLKRLANQGVRRIAVMAPAFTADCLETLDEIGREYAELFHRYGGKALRLIPSLNSHPTWIAALRDIVMREREEG